MYNPLLSTDSYKLSHFMQYPEGTEYVYSYIEPRKGMYPVVVMGIHDFIDYIFCELSYFNVDQLKRIATAHGVPFNDAWYSLVDKYEVSSEFPVKIWGVPEGTIVEPGTPVAAIVNTDPEFPWLTSFFETLFLRCVWYPSTVASRSRYIKTRIYEYMEKTGADMLSIGFKLHDFGSRGVSSTESAALGGAGHLTQFNGSDNLDAILYLDYNYGTMAGFSIPASEHSTVTSWTREGEKAMYENYIRKNGGEGKTFACVSDSYNIWEALKMWKELEPVLLEVGGTLVVRPDSGDPVLTPVRVIQELMRLFGTTTNDKGFLTLPDHIRVIQGDGINEDSIVRIMQLMYDNKLSLDNITFGMGGGLLQQCDRDTLGFAMKCSACCVNGEWRDVYKDPIAGGKTSKQGFVTSYGVVPYAEGLANVTTNQWVCYYDNDRTYTRGTWDQVVLRASI